MSKEGLDWWLYTAAEFKKVTFKLQLSELQVCGAVLQKRHVSKLCPLVGHKQILKKSLYKQNFALFFTFLPMERLIWVQPIFYAALSTPSKCKARMPLSSLEES